MCLNRSSSWIWLTNLIFSTFCFECPHHADSAAVMVCECCRNKTASHPLWRLLPETGGWVTYRVNLLRRLEYNQSDMAVAFMFSDAVRCTTMYVPSLQCWLGCFSLLYINWRCADPLAGDRDPPVLSLMGHNIRFRFQHESRSSQALTCYCHENSSPWA